MIASALEAIGWLVGYCGMLVNWCAEREKDAVSVEKNIEAATEVLYSDSCRWID